MKKNFGYLIAGVVALAATSAAYGQSAMKANIGFPFKMSSANLPAGSYDVVPASEAGSKYFVLRSTTEHKAVIVSPRNTIDRVDAAKANPRLVFKCDSHVCALAEIWTPDGAGYAAPKPKLSPAERERLAVVPLTVPKAD